jgi:hypothetical protein
MFFFVHFNSLTELMMICLNKDMNTTTQLTASAISSSADLHEKYASRNRLHQPKNIAPARVLQTKTITEKTSALRKQNRVDFVRVETAIWYWPIKGGVAKKV